MAVPWSAGEPWRAVTRRMARARKRWHTPLALELWRAALRQRARPGLPPPQAVVSVTGHLDIENPETAPMASGGAWPLAIVVGRESVSDGELQSAENALKFAKVVVTGWLARYKFRRWETHSSTSAAVSEADRRDRAQQIADQLCNHSWWLTHGRSIKIDDLRRARRLSS